MVTIINWMKGYLCIRVTGVAAERFINLCGYRNLLLWDVHKKEDSYEMYISVPAFRNLRPIVRKTKTKVVILKRVGLPFFLDDLNKRKVFLLGCMLAVFFWQISGNFIWSIKISGNLQVTEEQIMDFLEEQKIEVGSLKKKIPIENLEKQLRFTFPQITWISGKIDGTTFYIDIKEAKMQKIEVMFEEGVRYDLVANADGVIDSIIVRKGVPKVKPLDTVTKDTVLVEGIIPVYNDDGTLKETLYVKSDADIYIRYTYYYEDSIPERYIKKTYTGRSKSIPYIRFGEKEILLNKKPDYLISDTVIRENSSKLINDLKIPFVWGNYEYREYLNFETLYTENEASMLLESNFSKFLTTLNEKGVQIIEKDVTINKNGDMWVMKGEIVLSEPVSTLVKIEDINIAEAMEN